MRVECQEKKVDVPRTCDSRPILVIVTPAIRLLELPVSRPCTFDTQLAHSPRTSCMPYSPTGCWAIHFAATRAPWA
jgi:hypothetical protein